MVIKFYQECLAEIRKQKDSCLEELMSGRITSFDGYRFVTGKAEICLSYEVFLKDLFDRLVNKNEEEIYVTRD